MLKLSGYSRGERWKVSLLVKEEVIKLNKRFNEPKPILKIDKDTNRVIKKI